MSRVLDHGTLRPEVFNRTPAFSKTLIRSYEAPVIAFGLGTPIGVFSTVIENAPDELNSCHGPIEWSEDLYAKSNLS